MIFVVETKNPDTGHWEVVEGTGANTTFEAAEDEMKQDQADNPQVPFRVKAYFRADEGVKA